MDNNDLGYFLFMESREIQSKQYEELTEYEKVNLELNPFLVGEQTTNNRE